MNPGLDPGTLAADLVTEAGIAGPDGRPTLGGRLLVVLGVGWATVDLDRAVGDLAASQGIAADAGPDRPDAILGARWRSFTDLAGTIALVVLEPSTEGRLAAALARRDEGPAVLYRGPAAGPAGASFLSGLVGAGVRMQFGESALGSGGLVLGRPLGGPQVVLIAVPSGA